MTRPPAVLERTVPSASRFSSRASSAMVAAAGQWRLANDGPSPLSLGADPNLFFSFTG